jgi:PAS domain S-box-containing protein
LTVASRPIIALTKRNAPTAPNSPTDLNALTDRIALTEPRASASGHAPEFADIDLTSELHAELLDPAAWEKILSPYATTMRLAVALTDTEGHLLGACHNPQPVWRLARDGAPETESTCSFCLTSPSPCTAVADALRTGDVVTVHDQAGLAHIALPLSLGNRQLGAIIAGQIFDHFPEPLPLQRVARTLSISARQLWDAARRQAPIAGATLQVYGELLRSLGHAFLRERYGVILERRLAETNRRYRLLIDGVKDYALFTMDLAGMVTSWNAGAERLFGYSEAEIVGQSFSVFFTPSDLQVGAPNKELQKAAREGWSAHECWQVRKDGTRFSAGVMVTSLGEKDRREFGRVVHDVTERRKAENALLQAQKLESIGVLAGGIAHDFNNLLAGILGGVSLAAASLPLTHPARPLLKIAEQSSERAAGLTNQLLAYAGKGQFVITVFDLSLLISQTLPLIATSIPKAVQLNLDLGWTLPCIEADASQIQQVVMNLVINGAEAIAAAGGTLRVSTGVSGGDVYLEVRDSGSGMNEATQARIFDPFFTTKFTGRGLGLAAVSGIVRGHGGRMQVESVPGEGSTFRVFFPAAADQPVKPPQAVSSLDLHGTGLILVVDDEPALRELAQAILQQFGYSVLLAANGRDAVRIFQENAGKISAVLVDMTMPVMGGDEALRLIREISPAVPMIISTGFSEFTAREQFGADVVAGFIQKPYSPIRLGEMVKAALSK